MNEETGWDIQRVRSEVGIIKAKLSDTPPSQGTAMSVVARELGIFPPEWRGLALDMMNFGYDLGANVKETNRVAQRNQMIVFRVGLVLLGLGVALVFAFPHPTIQQTVLVCLVTSLGAASFIVMLPGFLELQGLMAPNQFFNSLKFKAGGGAAVFILVFVLMYLAMNH